MCADVDIVLPIFNGLDCVRRCLHALQNYTNPQHYRLIIIDDASDTVTRQFLNRQLSHFPNSVLQSNTDNLGFVKSCNLGISLGNAPFVLLLNSDVIVTPDWLPRLLACMASDERIAAANPLTNHAAQIDIPIVPGANFYGMDNLFKGWVPTYPDVVTNVGFCLLLRRAVLERVGIFDEIYGRGYCEESDLCMRLTTQGYRTVVADNVYVYHQGHATFSDSTERYLHNRRLFDQRWLTLYKKQFRAFRRANPLKPVRDLAASPHRWCPLPVLWTTYRQLRKQWQRHHFWGLVIEALRGLWQLPQSKCPIPDATIVARFTRPQRLRVTYLLNKLVIAGGVLSVVQLVNELILQGVEARIACLFIDPEIKHWRLLTTPFTFRNAQHLMHDLPETDIVVATHWLTARWAKALVQTGKARHSVYYLQDYESWFFPETNVRARQAVQSTYSLIDHKIVTSEWLQSLLAHEGYSSHKICISNDADVFYPRTLPKNSDFTVLAMARPGTPWRGFNTLIAALTIVKQTLPTTQIVLFGDAHLSRQSIPFEYRDIGILTRQNQLAMLYSQADVFVDSSDFQGFGRPALEAMACGCACVLTDVGGVQEYAQHESNCLLTPPRQPLALANAIERVLTSAPLRQTLIMGGLATASDYNGPREVQETLAYFFHIQGDTQQ